MKDAIVRLFSSMKFWTAVLGLITAIGAKVGFNVDPDVFWAIIGVVTSVILGQGLTDHGKEAAKITAAATVAATQTTTVTDVPAGVTVTAPKEETK